MVAGIIESERLEVERQRRRKAAQRRRKRRVGAPRPPGPPSDEAGTSGSLFVGKGLGLRKEVAKADTGGSVRAARSHTIHTHPRTLTHTHTCVCALPRRASSMMSVWLPLTFSAVLQCERTLTQVRQVLARILDDNPEVARLRRLEQSKLPF